MGKTIVSDFETYAQASEVVRNLELEGITGTEVKVVSDADHDTRGVVSAKYSTRYGAGRRIVNGMSHSSFSRSDRSPEGSSDGDRKELLTETPNT